MNTKQLLEFLLKKGWISKKQFIKYRNQPIETLIHKKIITHEQVLKAKASFLSAKKEYRSSQMQNEFLSLDYEYNSKSNTSSSHVPESFSDLNPLPKENKKTYKRYDIKESVLSVSPFASKF